MSKEQVLAIQSIVKGSGILFFGEIISFIVNFLYMIIMSRYLGPKSYGILSSGIVLLNIGLLVIRFGIPPAMSRFISFYRQKKEDGRVKGTILTGMAIMVLSSILVTLVGALILFVLSSKFALSIETGIIYLIFIICAPLAAFIMFFYETFLGFVKPFISIFVDSLMNKTMKLVIALVLVFLGASLFQISLFYLLGMLIPLIIGSIILNKLFFSKNKKTKSLIDHKGIINFSFPVFLVEILGMSFGLLDSLVIGFFYSSTEVGIYRIAYGLAAFLGVFSISFGSIFLPIMTEFYAKKDYKILSQSYSTVTSLIIFTMLPFAITFIFFSNQIVHMLFGSEYSGAAICLSLLAVAYLITAFVGPANYMLQVMADTKFLFISQVVAFFVLLASNLILVPKYGITGASISIIIGGIIFFAMMLIKINHTLNINFKLMKYIKSLISVFISLGISYYLLGFMGRTTFFSIGISFIVLFLFYVIFLIGLRSFDEEDLLIIVAAEEKTGLKSHIFSRAIRFNR